MIKVLVVEDDANKLASTVNVLKNTGLVTNESIETAPDALTARKRLEKTHYDLLILDLSIPELLGEAPNPDAGRSLLEDLNTSDDYLMPSRIIGLTGYDELAVSMSAEFQSYGVILVYYNPASTNWHVPIAMQVKQISTSKAAEKSSNKEYDVYLGIVCAVEVEFDAVQNLPWGFEYLSIDGDPTVYVQGKFKQNSNTRHVIAALCPRMGMSATAITATKLIQNFRPEIIAMTGITGAVRGQANLGDVIVAEECWDWGIGKWERKNNKPVFNPGPHHIGLDTDLRTAASRLGRDEGLLFQIRKEWPGAKPDTLPQIKIGPVASGSAVIAAQEMTDHIKSQHRKLIGIEMEAYSLYAAAADASYPRPRAIALKSASDFADHQKDDSFRHYCAYASAQALKHLVEIFLK